VTGRLSLYLEEIKFSHSVFALPFAMIAMLLAADGWPGLWTLLWIVVACVAARTAAMFFNRLADAQFDRRNPRTARRGLASGRLGEGEVKKAIAISAAAFVAAAAMLNPLCLFLSVPCLAVLLGYSVTKRFTHYTHFWLGLALGLAPVGAWVAVTGSLAWTPLLLGAAVMLWVAGFDILYSCQDHAFDSATPELHSLPKKLGIAKAMLLARRLHGGAVLLFFAAGAVAGMGWWWTAGVAAAMGLLAYQHSIVSPRDLSRINAAFFTANGAMSIVLFLAALLDHAARR
jgi:4-hydroxybenzoate polyprenyltransferase